MGARRRVLRAPLLRLAVPAALGLIGLVLDARLYRKTDGRESRLCFMGHVLMENRNGLAVDAVLTHATGTAERDAALIMIDRRKRTGRPAGPDRYQAARPR